MEAFWFTPLESPSIPAYRQTGMLGMVEMESISSLFLPAGRQGGRGQSPALSNGVYEKYYGLEDQFWGWRCIWCGNIIDQIILENRGSMAVGAPRL